MPDQMICHQLNFKKKGTEVQKRTKQFAARLKLPKKNPKNVDFSLESLCERRSPLQVHILLHYTLDETLSSSYC